MVQLAAKESRQNAFGDALIHHQIQSVNIKKAPEGAY